MLDGLVFQVRDHAVVSLYLESQLSRIFAVFGSIRDKSIDFCFRFVALLFRSKTFGLELLLHQLILFLDFGNVLLERGELLLSFFQLLQVVRAFLFQYVVRLDQVSNCGGLFLDLSSEAIDDVLILFALVLEFVDVLQNRK